MKVCVKISSNQPLNPVQMALTTIVRTLGYQIVETPEEAEVVVVNDIIVALELLKDDEDVKVLIAVHPGTWGSSERAGAPGLIKAFPGRVFARPTVEFDGEQNIVFFLMNLAEELK